MTTHAAAACQELAKTCANRVDRATQTGHADVADLDVLDTVEREFTLSCSLGEKCARRYRTEKESAQGRSCEYLAGCGGDRSRRRHPSAVTDQRISTRYGEKG